jgi:hypothetical protein
LIRHWSKEENFDLDKVIEYSFTTEIDRKTAERMLHSYPSDYDMSKIIKAFSCNKEDIHSVQINVFLPCECDEVYQPLRQTASRTQNLLSFDCFSRMPKLEREEKKQVSR